MKRLLVILAMGAVVLATGIAAHADGAAIRVRVTGLRNAKGDLLCALFADGAAFPGGEALAKSKTAPVLAGSECVFSNVPPGRYAVAVIHDENGNGKLDRVPLIGLPLEGYGVSNNHTYATHGPRFDESAFVFGGTDELIVEVTLRY